jgi:hypothetical protein
VPTLFSEAEGHTGNDVQGELFPDPAQSKTLHMRGNSLRGNREIPPTPATDGASGRPEKVTDRTSGMHVGGKSDDCVVPGKLPNKDKRLAEAVEGRRSTEGNTEQGAAARTQSRTAASSLLLGVRVAARRDRRARFTKVNWVLDADIQGFFDTINHGWLLKFLEHRIADRRILRLIQKWLRAGVSEDGQ